MAEKGFGVKEVNLIGASGTPTITSPNNLNLNAVNVAISTNVSIGGTLSVTGNVSVGGTLTYEDVTNIDSVGIVTARNGIDCNGDLDVDGHTNLDNVSVTGVATVTNSSNSNILIETSDTTSSRLVVKNSQRAFAVETVTGGIFRIRDGSVNQERLTINSSGNVSIPNDLDVDGHTNLDNVSIAGVVTATSFSGSGANLTGIAVTEAPVTDYTITSPTGSYYLFHGGGVDVTSQNPDLYLIRGQKYRFNNTTGSSHPFAFRNQANNADYTDGITGSQNGIQFFTVPYDAPSSLKYRCTIHTGSMLGTIYISGGDGTHKIVADANPVMEFDRGSANNTNLNLKYNGTLTGQLSVANEEVQLSTVGSNTDIAFYVGGIKKGYWKDTGELWFGSNNTYIKANQIRFGESGAAYIDQYTTGQDINFRTSVSSALDTTGMTLKSNGNLAFASGKGIDFSASGNASGMTNELLDDYEEGSFTLTPTASNGNAIALNSSYNTGVYTRVGNLVHIQAYLSFSSNSNADGYLELNSLPFTVDSNQAQASGHVRVVQQVYLNRNYAYLPDGAGYYNAQLYCNEGSTWIRLYDLNDKGRRIETIAKFLGGGADVFLNFSYLAA